MTLKRKLLCLRKLTKKHSKSIVCKEIEKIINVKLVWCGNCKRVGDQQLISDDDLNKTIFQNQCFASLKQSGIFEVTLDSPLSRINKPVINLSYLYISLWGNFLFVQNRRVRILKVLQKPLSHHHRYFIAHFWVLMLLFYLFFLYLSLFHLLSVNYRYSPFLLALTSLHIFLESYVLVCQVCCYFVHRVKQILFEFVYFLYHFSTSYFLYISVVTCRYWMSLIIVKKVYMILLIKRSDNKILYSNVIM